MKKIFFILLIIAVALLILFFIKKRNALRENNVTPGDSTAIGNEGTSTYSAPGFSFKYASKAMIDQVTTSLGENMYLVSKPEDVGESIKLVNTSALKKNDYCGDMDIKPTIMNGKNFTYCISAGEPATTYFYAKGDKTLVISVQGTNGLPYTHIVPGSVEIF